MLSHSAAAMSHTTLYPQLQWISNSSLRSNKNNFFFASPAIRRANSITRSDLSGSSESIGGSEGKKLGLGVGSPVIVIEAPPTLKTADSMPSLKVNSGLVKPGDVGRIMARKPKDVWAVRLTIGTYLLDAKYFKPLDIDQ